MTSPAQPAQTPPPMPSSRWVDIDGPVHYVDYGGPEDGPVLVCVHGLGGSLVNWAALAPLLTDSCRVMALDLAGFGHTLGGGRSTSVHANQRLLHRFLSYVVGGPAMLVGNSMGGLISSMEAAAHPDSVTGLVLIDPALPVGLRARPHPLVVAIFAAYSLPAIGHAIMSRRRSIRSTDQLAMDVLRLCCVDPSRVPEHVVEQHLTLARDRSGYPDIDAELIVAARSLLLVLALRRQHAAMLRGIKAPVLLLHGAQDRLVPVAAARATAAANPSWRFAVAEDVGHVPQLEVPEWTAEQILDWLATDAAEAADLTRRTG